MSNQTQPNKFNPDFARIIQELENKYERRLKIIQEKHEQACKEIVEKQLSIETSLMADFAEHKQKLSERVEQQGEQIKYYLKLLDDKLQEIDYASRQAFAFYETDLKKRFEFAEQNIQIVQEELQAMSVNRRQLVSMIKQLAKNIEDGKINL